MKMLDIKNHHDRDDKLFFDGETHTYMVDEIIFSSVTTLINNLFEEFDKKKSIEYMMKGKNWETHEFYGKTVEEIESIWTIRNKKAMDEGVKLHEDIEKFLNNINDLSYYTKLQIRDSRNEKGELNYLDQKQRLKAIEDKEVVDVSTSKHKKYKIKDLISSI